MNEKQNNTAVPDPIGNPHGTGTNTQADTLKVKTGPSGAGMDFHAIDTKARQAEAEKHAKSKAADIVFDIDEILEKEKAARGGGNAAMDTFNSLNELVIKLTRIKMKDKVAFFQLLSVMIGAGIPLVKALTILTDQTVNPRFKKIIAEMTKNVDKGSSLSESMSLHDTIFTEAQVGMVEAAEASGQMNEVLHQLAVELEKTQRIQARVKGAMRYPMMILGLLIAVGVLMMILVIPKLTVLFTDSAADLPWPTKFLIFTSEALTTYSLHTLLGLIGVVIAFLFWKRTEAGKYYFDVFKLNIPVLGSLNRKVCLSRFARGLAGLLHSGIPIVKALLIDANGIGNEVYKQRIEIAAEDVKRGIPLGENLSGNKKLFPPMITHMIAIGEQTAQMDTIANKIADFFDEEVDVTVQSLSKLMEPLIMIVVGFGVAFMVAAIMMPILQLADITSVL